MLCFKWALPGSAEPKFPQMTSSPRSSLEGLPPELRRAILESVLELDTLHRLTQASPVFYQTYHVNRDAIWTRLSQHLLALRHVDILNEPTPCVVISLKEKAVPDSNVYQAVHKCYKQMHDGVSIRLTVQDCKALLQIIDSIQWKLLKGPHGGSCKKPWSSRGGLDRIQHTYVAEFDKHFWHIKLNDKALKEMFPEGWGAYHTLCFGDQFGTALAVSQHTRYVLPPHQVGIVAMSVTGILPPWDSLVRASTWKHTAQRILRIIAWLSLIVALFAILFGLFGRLASYLIEPQPSYSSMAKRFEPTWEQPKLRYQGPLEGQPGLWSCTEKRPSVRAVYACQRIETPPTTSIPPPPTSTAWSWKNWF